MSEINDPPAAPAAKNDSGAQNFLPFAALVGALLAALIGLVRLAQRSAGREPTPPPAPRPRPSISTPPPVRPASGASALPPISPPSPPGLSNPATRFTRPTKYVVGVILFLAMVYLVWISRGVITLVIFAALIAFLVQPVIRLFTRWLRGRRAAAVALAYLLALIILIAIPLVLLPAIFEAIAFLQTVDLQDAVEQIGLLVDQVNAFASGNPGLSFLLAPFIDAVDLALQSLSTQTPVSVVPPQLSVESVGGQLMQRLGWIAAVLGPAASAVFTLVFLILLAVYFSLSGEQLFEAVPRLLPPAYVPEVNALIARIGDVWAAFLRGQLTLMVFIGLLTYIGNLVLGTPQALLLALIAGFMELVPNIGPVLATIPAVILGALLGSSHLPVENWAFALMVVAFYTLVQFIENQFAVPIIMGDAVDLPPLVVIIGVLVGASVAGVLGVFLATPIIATGREVFNYLYDKILEPEPEPEPPPEPPSLWQRFGGLAQQARAGLSAQVKRLPWPRRQTQPLPPPHPPSFPSAPGQPPPDLHGPM